MRVYINGVTFDGRKERNPILHRLSLLHEHPDSLSENSQRYLREKRYIDTAYFEFVRLNENPPYFGSCRTQLLDDKLVILSGYRRLSRTEKGTAIYNNFLRLKESLLIKKSIKTSLINSLISLYSTAYRELAAPPSPVAEVNLRLLSSNHDRLIPRIAYLAIPMKDIPPPILLGIYISSIF